MQEILLTLASLISIITADRLIQSYVRSRARREACKGLAGVATALLGVGLATLAFGYFRDWGGEAGSGAYAILFKTSYFLQHTALPVLAASAAMHLNYVVISLAIVAAVALASIVFAIALSWSEVDLVLLEQGGSSELFHDPLPVAIALTLAVSGALIATVFYVKTYRMRGGRDGVPYLMVVLGLALMTLALVVESFGFIGTLESSLLKLLATAILAYGLISVKPLPGPLC